MKRFTALIASAALSLGAGSVATAATIPVTDWHTFRATTATTLGGQGTNAPTMGSTTASSSNGFIVGYLPNAIALTNVGDFVTLSFNVSFNDATGVTNNGDNFRWALFDLNGQTPVSGDNFATAGVDGQTDDWRGYWFGHKGGGGAGTNGSIRERTAALASGDNIFAAAAPNNTSAPSLGAVGGTAVTIAGSVNGDNTGPLYTGTLTLTKTAAGIDLSGSFSGTNGANANSFSVSDNTTPSPASFRAVAFLNGSGISADQVIFQNVNVLTNVPEPAAAGVLALSAMAIGMRRRRA
jgi:hypothetical protein